MARRRLHDRYFKQAKAEGYVARSAYKLLEINEKRRLLGRGDRVLDLGCAPGSWLQVASELVGPRGVVIGVDLQRVRVALPGNVRASEADLRTLDVVGLLEAEGLDRFDVVLSDMAPNTSGSDADHYRSVELCRAILERVEGTLRAGGHLAMTGFEGSAYPDLLSETGARFERCKGLKPKASRDVSREIYIVAEGFKASGAG